MVCLDTSFLIDVLQARESAQELMVELDEQERRPAVTPVTASELWVGANLGSDEEYEATRNLLATLTWLDITRPCARRAGAIQASLKRGGNPLGFADCLIAATAIEHDQTLVTGDGDFERVPDLRVRTY